MSRTTENFDLPHGRTVRIEETLDSTGVTALTLDSPSYDGKVYLRMAGWKSEHARKRGDTRKSLGMELDREGAEALHALLGELLAEPDAFQEH